MRNKGIVAVLMWTICGIVIGIITGYLRTYSPMSFWCFSDIAGRYGFWIFTVSLIAIAAAKPIKAGVHSFIYMLFMCISYYTYLYFTKGIFYRKQFILWVAFAFFAAVYAFFIRKAKVKHGKRDLVICIIPLLLLGVEFMNMLDIFVKYRTNFFQLLVDFIGCISLGYLFTKGASRKDKTFILGLAAVLTAAVCGVFLILWSI